MIRFSIRRPVAVGRPYAAPAAEPDVEHVRLYRLEKPARRWRISD
ncbi:MAG TPA: hypothetical protein VHG08_19740 [Longimicrobium sp.]|nr:hypothetical protein [Longimicrobium sp.]